MVRYLSDRIAVLYLGRLMEVGPAERVFSGPHHPYTEALLSAVPTLDGSRPRADPARGRDPERGRSAERLRVPHPLPAQDRRDLRDHRAAAGRGRGRPRDPLSHPDRGARAPAGPRGDRCQARATEFELARTRAAAGVSPAAIETRAAVLREPGRPVAVETVVLAAPRRGEVLVRVAAAGVCHSDVHLADGLLGDGRWPMVLGHEGAGVVEAVGEGVAELAPGDHVAFCFVPACGNCGPCRSGRRTLCETARASLLAGTLLDGTSRLRALDGTVLQHGLMVACFAELRGRAGRRRGTAAAVDPAMAGGAAGLRRGDRDRRGQPGAARVGSSVA